MVLEFNDAYVDDNGIIHNLEDVIGKGASLEGGHTVTVYDEGGDTPKEIHAVLDGLSIPTPSYNNNFKAYHYNVNGEKVTFPYTPLEDTSMYLIEDTTVSGQLRQHFNRTEQIIVIESTRIMFCTSISDNGTMASVGGYQITGLSIPMTSVDDALAYLFTITGTATSFGGNAIKASAFSNDTTLSGWKATFV